MVFWPNSVKSNLYKAEDSIKQILIYGLIGVRFREIPLYLLRYISITTKGPFKKYVTCIRGEGVTIKAIKCNVGGGVKVKCDITSLKNYISKFSIYIKLMFIIFKDAFKQLC